MSNKNLLVMVMIFIFFGFVNPSIANSMEVGLSNYESNLKATLKNKEYDGQKIIIHQMSMENNSGISAFSYQGDDSNVSYRTGTIQNYLWYALKKSFGAVGLKVLEYSAPLKNTCELSLAFTFFNADKATFLMGLSRNGYLLMQKEITVAQKPTQSLNVNELEKRQYVYFDLIAAAILDDPSFKKAFFSDKGKIE